MLPPSLILLLSSRSLYLGNSPRGLRYRYIYSYFVLIQNYKHRILHSNNHLFPLKQRGKWNIR